jgi:hypothetical protein
MKKLSTIFLMLCGIATATYSQLDTFDLSIYKLPDIKRHQLELQVDLNGYTSSQTVKDEGADSQSEAYNNFRGGLQIGYQLDRNSRKFQSYQNFSVSMNPSFRSHIIEDTLDNSDFIINPGVNLISVNRIYLTNKFFIEPDASISGSLESSTEDDRASASIDKDYNTILDFELRLLTGFGRIEPVEDARLAVYILEDLYKAGRIARMPNNDEIVEFATLISQLKNERFFDYRIHKMYEIEQVDSFLQAKGLVSNADAKYFTTVNDNWDYAGGPERNTGGRISFGIVPKYILNFYNHTIDYDYAADYSYEYNSGGYDLSAIASYYYAKPLNLKWQINTLTSLSYGFFNSGNDETFDNGTTSNEQDAGTYIEANANGSLGYYPNSRTSVLSTVGIDFTQGNSTYTHDDDSEDKYKDYELTPQFRIDGYYYFSPQLRLRLYYNISYRYTNNDNMYSYETEYHYTKTNRLNQSFNLSLIYSFF